MSIIIIIIIIFHFIFLNSIFSSTVRESSCQWEGKHSRYILITEISWTPILSEQQHVYCHAPSCCHQEQGCLTVTCKRPLSYDSLFLTFVFSSPNFFLFTTLIPSVTNSSSLFTLSTFALILLT